MLCITTPRVPCRLLRAVCDFAVVAQIWLKRASRPSDPTWHLAKVTEVLANKFVKVTVISPSAQSTEGCVELKDQSPGSTAFVVSDPSATADNTAAPEASAAVSEE